MRTGGWRRVNTGARRFVSGAARLQVVSRSDLGRPWHGYRRPTGGVNVSASAARFYPRGRAPSFAMQARAALSTGATVDPVVSPGWLAENLGSVKVLDATWYLPSKKKEGRETHRVGPRIPGAKYFCIDAIASQDAASLKHMLPPPDAFAAAADALGLKNSDTVVVYEANGMAFAAARAWWMFRCFGHENVKVLNGGLPAWIREREAGGGPASAFGLDESEAPEESVDAGGNASVSAQAAGGGGSSAAYRAELNPGLVVSKADILSDLDLGKGKKMHLLDARGAARYKVREWHAKTLAPKPVADHRIRLSSSSSFGGGWLATKGDGARGKAGSEVRPHSRQLQHALCVSDLRRRGADASRGSDEERPGSPGAGGGEGRKVHHRVVRQRGHRLRCRPGLREARKGRRRVRRILDRLGRGHFVPH